MTKNPCTRLDALPLRFTDRVLHLFQGLLLVQPVQDLLGARLHPKGQKIAVGLFHERQLINRDRIHPAFAAPVELQAAFNDAVANFADALAVQEKVIIGQVNRAIAHDRSVAAFLPGHAPRNGSAICPATGTGYRSRCRNRGSLGKSAWCRIYPGRGPPGHPGARIRCNRWAGWSGRGKETDSGPGGADAGRSGRSRRALRQTRPATEPGSSRWSR